MNSYEILVVDDEQDIGRLICDTLQDEGYQTRYAASGAAAVDAIRQRRSSLVVLDIWLGDSHFDGMKVLDLIKKDHPDIPVVMMSGHGTIETAVKALKMGAYDFIEKPFKMDRLLLVLERALEIEQLRRENEELRARSDDSDTFIGDVAVPSSMRQTIDRVASTSSRVLISGPYGSGKKIVSRVIHQKSARKSGPFVICNCSGSTSEEIEKELFGQEEEKCFKIGALEKAHNGTLLIDQIDDLSLDLQGKLLRALQDGSFRRVSGTRTIQVDIRLLSSTDKDIAEAVQKKEFREDLYYRINVVPVQIPALRNRPEDIPHLAQAFLKFLAPKYGMAVPCLTSEATMALQAYEWPGNLRQLKNVLEWVCIMCAEEDSQEITTQMLPSDISADAPALLQSTHSSQLMDLPLKEAKKRFEQDYFEIQSLRFSHNVSRIAGFVQMDRSALHRKLKTLKIYRNKVLLQFPDYKIQSEDRMQSGVR